MRSPSPFETLVPGFSGLLNARFKIVKVVKMQQLQAFRAYKKKHSFNRQKYFYCKIVHYNDEFISVLGVLAFLLLERPRNGKGISRFRTNQPI
jgi:hypothetical protein